MDSTKEEEKPTGHDSPVVADVVSESLPVVVVLGQVERVKCHGESGREVLHQHRQLIVHQTPTGADGEDGCEPGHGGRSSCGRMRVRLK